MFSGASMLRFEANSIKLLDWPAKSVDFNPHEKSVGRSDPIYTFIKNGTQIRGSWSSFLPFINVGKILKFRKRTA